MGEAQPFRPGNPDHPSLAYLFLRFLRYGFLAWGGPVAQISLMHRELVDRDAWITETRFRKTLALYQILPGPEAHELAVYFGTLKRGRWGGFLTGLAFMLPGVVLVTIAAALYVHLAPGASAVERLVYGIRPAVVALIAVAFLRLLRANVTQTEHVLIAVGAGVVAFTLPHVNFLVLLFLGGLAALAATPWTTLRGSAWMPWALLAAFPALNATGLVALAILSAKVGLLTFGGAYTALPFLQDGAVEEHGWITNAQFLDAVAIAGILPGPLIALGTFIGYEVASLPGALLATVLIFAPAFAFTLVGHGFFERLLEGERIHGFLLGVAAALMGLLAHTFVPLAGTALPDAATTLLALAAGLALSTRRVPIPLVLLASGIVGSLWLLR